MGPILILGQAQRSPRLGVAHQRLLGTFFQSVLPGLHGHLLPRALLWLCRLCLFLLLVSHLVDDEEVAAEGAGRGVAQATEETLGCGAVLLVLRYVALELQPRVRGKATFRTLEKRLVPFGGRDWRAIAGVRSGPHSTDWSFQMVHLRGMSTRRSGFGCLAQIRISDTVHKADVALQEGGPRKAGAVLCAIPTSVDFLHCVMVVADVFAQAVGGVKGLFTLPTRVPLQRPTVTLFHVGHVALPIWNPLLALLAGPAGVPQPGPGLSPAVGLRPAPAAGGQGTAPSSHTEGWRLSRHSRARAA